MTTHPAPGKALLTCGLVLLLGLATACQDSDPPEPADDETPALQTVEPDQPTADPSPSPEPGEQHTLTVRQSTQGRAFGLSIGVASTTDNEARLSVGYNDDDDDDTTEGVTGEAGDTVELDSGYTLTIDEIDHERDSVEQEGQGTGSVTVTVTAPE